MAAKAADQSRAPQQAQSQQSPQDADRQGRKSGEPRRNNSLGQELVRETREAAGEEEKDETAVFKQAYPVQWIAAKTGLSLLHAYWLCVVFNFAVIGVVIVYLARKYLPGMFRARTESIQRAMQEAQKASEEARRRLADIESRLRKLDDEIGAMRDAAEKDGAAEEARIKAAAEQDAHKIIEGAQLEIAAAAKAARRELTAYAADLAVGLAKKQIHVDSATDQSLVQNFAGRLTAAPSGPGKENS